MTEAFRFLKHRRATEQETHDFYREKRQAMADAEAKGLTGKEKFAFLCERGRNFPFYYSTQLNCVMYAPPDAEVFQNWFRQQGFSPDHFDVAHEAWQAACAYYRESNYDEQTHREYRAGVERLRKMTQAQIRQQRADHEKRYP
jgi:hypothetical protein